MKRILPSDLRSLTLILCALGLTQMVYAGEIQNQKPTDTETRDWPQWRGPNNNGSAVEPTQPMVNSILKRPIVWVSEDRQPLFYGYCMSANSGCGAPFAADGRLFFFHRAASERMQFPVSEAEQKRASDSFRVNGGGDLRNARAVEIITRETWVKWLTNIAADEVVVCMDMATGRTLRRTALPIRLEQTGGRFIQCAGAAYGRVYVQSLRDICFACLDAETGEVLWMDLNDRELIAGERSLACQIRQHKNGAGPGTGAVSCHRGSGRCRHINARHLRCLDRPTFARWIFATVPLDPPWQRVPGDG